MNLALYRSLLSRQGGGKKGTKKVLAKILFYLLTHLVCAEFKKTRFYFIEC